MQVKAGVTGWWHRLLRAVASGWRTVGEGLWASCGPDQAAVPCSFLVLILLLSRLNDDRRCCRARLMLAGSRGRRRTGRGNYGRMADGVAHRGRCSR
jgi:hypothetical protein